MADLTFTEKAIIEKFLEMKSGYVLDFSDRTFQNFVGEAVNLDIENEKYHYSSNSKANRLRQFIKVESSYVFGKLLIAFCDYWLSKVHLGEINPEDNEYAYKECRKIAEKLSQQNIVEHIDAIKPNVEDKDFKLLAKSIRESIEKNEPETALDRLHTFIYRYLRELCEKHGISYQRSDSLNAIMGKYIKFLTERELLESIMSEKILKYSINVIEAFNDIRNNKSFAHDNPILNYNESILILNSVSNTIKFIESIETIKTKAIITTQSDLDDLPF
jgi:hypothetical protein